MKNFKKVIAGALALLMLALSVNVSFAAEEYSDEEAIVVGKVNAAGIMTGTDKGFEPSKSLTRAEAAAIIVRMKGISESAVKSMSGTTLFTDVAASHWASGYVNQASNLGIIKGVSATQFAPDREVTVAEFVTMAVRALGAGQLVDAEGTWPTNYVNFANENGILDDVNAIYTSVATRLQAATIVVNTLEANMWTKGEYDTTGKITFNKGDETILFNVLKLIEGKVTIDKINSKDSIVKEGEKPYDVAEGVDLSELRVGLTYNVYATYKKTVDDDNQVIYVIDEIKGFWIDDNDTVKFTAIADYDKNGTADDYADDTIKLTVDGKDKEYKVKASNVKYYSNEEQSSKYIYELLEDENVFGTAYLDNNGKITNIYLTDYEVYAVVDEVTATKVKFDTSVEGDSGKASLVTNVDDNEYSLTKDGVAIKYADLEEGDAIAYYETTINTSDKKYVGEVLESIEGKVTATRNDSVTIDKVKYDNVSGTALSAGDEIKAWLNHAGEICMFDYIDEDKASDVAIVTYYKPYEDKYGWQNADVKLTFMDGTTSDMLSIDIAASLEDCLDLDGVKEATGKNKFTYDECAQDAEKTLADLINYIKDVNDSTISTSMLGYAVCYSVSDSEVTFKKLSAGKDLEFNEVAEGAKLIVGKKFNTISAADGITDSIYVTEDATVLKLKADGTYGIKVEKVSVSELDKESVFKGLSYVIDYNEDDADVKAVVFGLESELTRTTETNFAFIEQVRSAEKVDKKEAKEVDVIYVDGNRATLMMVDGTTSSYNTVKAYEGKFVDLAVNSEDVITSADLLTEDDDDLLTVKFSEKEYQMVKYNESKDEITVKVGDTDTPFTIADEMLVLKLKDDEYTIKSIADLNEYDADAKENTMINTLVTYTDEDGEEVALIIYKVKKSN